MLLLLSAVAMGQDGDAGINEATNQIKSYFSNGTNLMCAIRPLFDAIKSLNNVNRVPNSKPHFSVNPPQKSFFKFT